MILRGVYVAVDHRDGQWWLEICFQYWTLARFALRTGTALDIMDDYTERTDWRFSRRVVTRDPVREGQ